MTTYDFTEVELQALKGKTILITGASTGIGRDTVKIAHGWWHDRSLLRRR
jgi:NAD(P)-dependent dehydrogenase (short-subunit alcohol dehydrogenase family)